MLSIASVVRAGQRSYFICGERSLLELLNTFDLIGCVLCTLCMQGVDACVLYNPPVVSVATIKFKSPDEFP